MKKTLIAIGAIIALSIFGFVFLVRQASPDNAPIDVKVIELPDTYEK